jgi:hypothetical protein
MAMRSVTLDEIHRDPGVLDRALELNEVIEIRDQGKLAGTLVPAAAGTTRYSERGFPISRGLAPFGNADVARFEDEADRQ